MAAGASMAAALHVVGSRPIILHGSSPHSRFPFRLLHHPSSLSPHPSPFRPPPPRSSLPDRSSPNLPDDLPLPPSPPLQSGTWIQGDQVVSNFVEQNDPLWEQISVIVRMAYAVGVYGVMGLVGQSICLAAGIDRFGGFDMSADVVMQGLGYAVPPMMALLFILDDEVVKKSLHARAIRDVENEELMSFFDGLSPWQVLFIVTLAATVEELFFRVAIQGGLAHVFLSDDKVKEPIDGIASLTGIFPSLAPFAHALAAVLTAVLTGSVLFIVSFLKDPKYVFVPVLRNRTSLLELKKSFAAWYERRQCRRIYSPLLESILALYLGFEWMQTGNILAPVITHVIYSIVTVGNGVRRIHEQRDRLRQRTRTLWEKSLAIPDYKSEKL